MRQEKWIALAEVAPTSACLELDRPAFVNVIGLAVDKQSFVELIRSECEDFGCLVTDVEELERWEERLANWQPDDEVIAQAALVSDKRPLVFRAFFCFPVEDAG